MDRGEFNFGLLTAVGLLIAQAHQPRTQLQINGRRLNDHLRALAEFGKNPQGGVSRCDVVARWTADGRGFLASRWSEVPVRLERVDLATGRGDFVRRLAPPDLAGVVRIERVTVAGDENVYACSPLQLRSDLFLVDGAR